MHGAHPPDGPRRHHDQCGQRRAVVPLHLWTGSPSFTTATLSGRPAVPAAPCRDTAALKACPHATKRSRALSAASGVAAPTHGAVDTGEARESKSVKTEDLSPCPISPSHEELQYGSGSIARVSGDGSGCQPDSWPLSEGQGGRRHGLGLEAASFWTRTWTGFAAPCDWDVEGRAPCRVG